MRKREQAPRTPYASRGIGASAHLVVVLGWLCLVTPPEVAQPANTNAGAYTWTTLAGHASLGSADGVGSFALFLGPFGVAVDANGNAYVADPLNYTVRKITPAGVVSTVAGFAGSSGIADGTNSAARFLNPQGIAVSTNGDLYVADSGSHTVRRIMPFGTNWVVSTIAGYPDASGSKDGVGNSATFGSAQALTVDPSGNIYVADSATIRRIALVGTNWVVSTIAGQAGIYGSTDGAGTNALFQAPAAITVDSAGIIYVADQDTIRNLTPTSTNWVVSTIAGSATNSGTTDGTNGSARFKQPNGIGVDTNGYLYVADSGNDTIRKVIPIGATNWVVSTLAGRAGAYGSADGVGTNALFGYPAGLALDKAGNVYVADYRNNTIRKVTSAGAVVTLAGLASSAGSADGVGDDARFYWPAAVAVDDTGNVYVADTGNNTIRKITSAGEVTTVAGLAGVPGGADGVAGNARFNKPQGITVDDAGNLYVADSNNNSIRQITPAGVVRTIAGSTNFDSVFAITLNNSSNIYVLNSLANFPSSIEKITQAGTNWVVSVIDAGPLPHCYGIAADRSGDLYVTGFSQILRLAPSDTNWLVTTIALRIANALALDREGSLYVTTDVYNLISKLTPAGTNWLGSAIGGLYGGYPDSTDGAGSAARFYDPQGIAVDRAGNLYVADTYNNTIRKGVFTAYTTTNPVPYTPPPMNSQLVVTLTPTNANGQWRFPWELGWRKSGQAATNLTAANYPVQFRSLPGWLTFPSSLTAVVTPGSSNSITTNVYYPTLIPAGTNGSSGSLTVNLGPNPPSGAGWRFLGDTTEFFPSGFRTNLLAGSYLIEFAPAPSGRSTPPRLSVPVYAGQPTVISVNYLLAQSPPGGVELPTNVPPAYISDQTDYPFGFNGQLQSDVGYGSGVAVLANVVLTAAHLVFDDQTLSYVSQAYWFFQQETGVFSPTPLLARGWCILSDNGGYAAQRTNDLQIYSPDVSTPQSRNLDLAALYFTSPVAGGGFGGYLPSDAVPNSWLSSTAQKMLVGYPVDGSLFGDTNIVAGVMYQTEPQPYPLSLATDPVYNQQVYTAPWFLSYPGNSGGPLYVLFNGYYYPAGVYLGTLFNGTQPYASAVRAIDSEVVNLLGLAAVLGNGGTNSAGTNNTGGGVITVSPGQGISATNAGNVGINLGPPAAVQAGAGWRVQGDTAYSPSGYYERVTSTNAIIIEFAPIPGWNPPANNQTIAVYGGQITNVTALYSDLPPSLSYSPAEGLRLFGASMLTYRIESTTNLSQPIGWITNATISLSNLTLTNNSKVIAGTRPDNSTRRFFRASRTP